MGTIRSSVLLVKALSDSNTYGIFNTLIYVHPFFHLAVLTLLLFTVHVMLDPNWQLTNRLLTVVQKAYTDIGCPQFFESFVPRSYEYLPFVICPD